MKICITVDVGDYSVVIKFICCSFIYRKWPELQGRDITKLLGQVWKELPGDSKKHYRLGSSLKLNPDLTSVYHPSVAEFE